MRARLLITLFAVSPFASASAQNHPWTLTALVGPSSYDLSGVGTTFAAAAHFGWLWAPAIMVEPGVTYFGYQEQFGRRTTFLFPEVSLQVMVPKGPIRPYLGAGAGRTVVVNRGGDHLSLHAVLGIRVPIDRGWGLRGELRARAPYQWGASMTDFMFGLSHRL